MLSYWIYNAAKVLERPPSPTPLLLSIDPPPRYSYSQFRVRENDCSAYRLYRICELSEAFSLIHGVFICLQSALSGITNEKCGSSIGMISAFLISLMFRSSLHPSHFPPKLPLQCLSEEAVIWCTLNHITSHHIHYIHMPASRIVFCCVVKSDTALGGARMLHDGITRASSEWIQKAH